MKYTQISAKNTEILENLIIKHGQIISVQNIYAETGNLLNHKQTEYFISALAKQGWLIRIKKGLYMISDLSGRGFLSLSSYVVANLLNADSYVSFESALHHHGMFDQLTNKVVSVSLKRYKTAKLQDIEYSFIKTKAAYYFGWQEVAIENKTARVATAEKALIDIVNFHKSVYAIDLVIEKLREYKNNIDFAALVEHLKKFSTTTVKIFGFIFDLLGIDSSDLFTLVKNQDGAHRMVANAKKFNAKWRLYYDEYFNKYATL
ncbi:MAG: type IV toxin-antitoxin system AbiEi family antitoxin [Candidatus Magasanikbacteria bacterium]|nr:type IV toxin-antitoxin system AbiEi family antitoxin [Candidatus Magasanikbacteria bacterium]